MKHSKCEIRMGFTALLLLLASCASVGQHASTTGDEALRSGDFDRSVAAYTQALAAEPDNTHYRLQLQVARTQSAIVHLQRGNTLLEAGDFASASGEFQLAFQLDPTLKSAESGMRRARQRVQAQQLVADAEQLLQARRPAQARKMLDDALLLVPGHPEATAMIETLQASQLALIEGVELEVLSDQPINLSFRETKLSDALVILTQLTGINFILDKDLRNTTTSLFVRDATFAQTLEMLLTSNKLDKKVLNGKTIIIFAKTAEKQKQYFDQVVQVFYLSNVDAKKALNLLRTMLQLKKVYVHEELNAIVVRDQPDVVALVQRLLEATDLADSEVIFDVEVIEVNQTDSRDLGVNFSNYSIGVGVAGDGKSNIAASSLAPGSSTTNLLSSLNGLETFFTLPTATFQARKTEADTDVLASPKIRVRNHAAAKVLVGSREPVITVTINDTLTSESVTYVDVGVKLDIEAIINLDDTVVTKLGLEVSNVSNRERTSSGTVVLTISTTNANTTLTLKDGEQTVIGGLIRNDNSVSNIGVPILSDIPVLGRLFTGTTQSKGKREILLSITPHIVRSFNMPRSDVARIWSGSDENPRDGRTFGAFAEDYRAGHAGVNPTPVTGLLLPEPPSAAGGDDFMPSGMAAPAPFAGSDPMNVGTQMVAPPAAFGGLPDIAEPDLEALVPAPADFGGLPETGEPDPDAEVPAPLDGLLLLDSVPEVKAGETFVVTVSTEGLTDLHSAPFSLRYPAALVEFVSATEGPFLGAEGAITSFATTPAAGRTVIVLEQDADGAGVSGNGELLQLVLRARAAGTAELVPEQIDFRTQAGNRIEVQASGIKVRIAP